MSETMLKIDNLVVDYGHVHAWKWTATRSSA